MSVVGKETDGTLYVIGATSRHGGYVGFACLRLIQEPGPDGQIIRIDTETDGDVRFERTPQNPSVTWFTSDQRRAVLGMMARYPKRFERCEIVRVDKLSGYGSPATDALEGELKDALEGTPDPAPRKLDTATRCKLATSLSRASGTDLRELAKFAQFLGHRKEYRTGEKWEASETVEMLQSELERRDARARAALERIWLEPIGHVDYTPAPEPNAGRGTKPQPGDE